MNGTRFLIVADAAPAAGLGHLARCSGVVRALVALGASTRAAALGSGADVDIDGVRWLHTTTPQARVAARGAVVLVDSYRLDPRDVRGWAPQALAWFDDAQPARDVADLVVIAPRSATADDAPGRRILDGFEHVSIRPGMSPRPRPRPTAVASLLVTLGATPGAPTMELARAVGAALPGVVLRAVSCAPPERGVEIVSCGASLADEFARADMVVCGGGQTSLEAAAWGIPTVVVPIADNQRANAERLRSIGAALVAGNAGAAGEMVRALVEDKGKRVAMSRAGPAAVDGHGAARIAAALAAIGTGSSAHATSGTIR